MSSRVRFWEGLATMLEAGIPVRAAIDHVADSPPLGWGGVIGSLQRTVGGGRTLAEGMEARWARHERLYRRTAEWAASRGCTYAAAEGARSLTVSCLKPPAGVDPRAIVKGLAQRGWTIGGGYGDWKPTTFRIGHMGEVRESDLEALLAEIDVILAKSMAQVAG